LRYSIIYGSREWFGRVLTVFLKRALDGKAPVVWGGDQIRDFCYVTDVIAFHNLLIKNDEIKNGVFNVSTGIETSISNLARMVADIFDLDESVYENVNEGEMPKRNNR
jgi:UDP-glucose 4-epimerase